MTGPGGDEESREIAIELPLAEYDVTLLSPDVALARYLSRTGRGDQRSMQHRTSIWVLHDGAWRLRFHQGTPATDVRAP